MNTQKGQKLLTLGSHLHAYPDISWLIWPSGIMSWNVSSKRGSPPLCTNNSLCKCYVLASHTKTWTLIALNRPDEIITPHQTTLLKIIDSYLQSNQSSPQTSIKPETLYIHSSLTPMLTRCFLSLSRYAQDSIRRSLGLSVTVVDDSHSGESERHRVTSEGSLSPPPVTRPAAGSQEVQDQSLQSLDVMLPKVCEALVLVTQCMVTIAIEAEEYVDQPEENNPKANVRNYFIEARPLGVGVVESLIGEHLRHIKTR